MIATTATLVWFCCVPPIAQQEAPSHAPTAPLISKDAARPAGGIHALENCGQWGRETRFAAAVGHTKVNFANGGIAFTASNDKTNDSEVEPNCSTIFLAFEGANGNVEIMGTGESKTQNNFFRGPTESGWHPGIPSFDSIRYKHLYNGVDLLIHSRNGFLEYDLELAPGADVTDVIIACHGAESLQVDESGDLVIQTGAGPMKQLRPNTYEVDGNGNRRPVICTFNVLRDNRFSFTLCERHFENQIIIDPGIIYSTYLEGSSWDDGAGSVTTDSALNCYVAGVTGAFDFPTTVGPSFQGVHDIFVTKLSPDGTSLVYSTFVGGGNDEWTAGISIDGTGNAIICGTTRSFDYPTTPGAFDTTYNGGPPSNYQDVVVSKLNATGTSLIYSTFLGGSFVDSAFGKCVASNVVGEAHITGTTSSTNFPTTPGAADTILNVVSSAFVTKFNASGSALAYSTFWGGNGGDQGRAIALDESGSAYVLGVAGSSGFPTTPGAWIPNYKGAGDAFVAKFNSTGGIVYSTIVGGIAKEDPNGIAVNKAGIAVVAGYTESADFPTTHGTFQPTKKFGADGFVTVINVDGTKPIYSTYLGGNNVTYGIGAHISDENQVTITGYTGATDFPITPGAWSSTINNIPGYTDVIITKFNSKGNKLVYSTYFGGNGPDYGVGIALDSAGSVYLAGSTISTNFPTTPTSFDPVYSGGGFDAFVTKLELPISNYGAGTSGCNGPQVLFVESPPNINNTSFELRCSNAPASSLGILLISDQAIDGDPFGIGLNLLVDLTSPAFFPLDMSSDAAGMGYVVTAIPNDTNLIGQVFYLQTLWLWSAGTCTPSPLGLSSSNRLNITLVAP
ncbi:MAG: SBBP repeat-containing protein [Planctomycetes bacterium]|nr:SBBP repeat-containing protein [Planctomycetota bacterium]